MIAKLKACPLGWSVKGEETKAGGKHRNHQEWRFHQRANESGSTPLKMMKFTQRSQGEINFVREWQPDSRKF